jgi:hypothetical protein
LQQSTGAIPEVKREESEKPENLKSEVAEMNNTASDKIKPAKKM